MWQLGLSWLAFCSNAYECWIYILDVGYIYWWYEIFLCTHISSWLKKPTCAGALIVQAQALYALGNFEHALVWQSTHFRDVLGLVSCTGGFPQSGPAGGTSHVREGGDPGGQEIFMHSAMYLSLYLCICLFFHFAFASVAGRAWSGYFLTAALLSTTRIVIIIIKWTFERRHGGKRLKTAQLIFDSVHGLSSRCIIDSSTTWIALDPFTQWAWAWAQGAWGCGSTATRYVIPIQSDIQWHW